MQITIIFGFALVALALFAIRRANPGEVIGSTLDGFDTRERRQLMIKENEHD